MNKTRVQLDVVDEELEIATRMSERLGITRAAFYRTAARLYAYLAGCFGPRRTRTRAAHTGPGEEDMSDTRKRLLAASRHLNATRFGWVMARTFTRGVDWSGSPKGDMITQVDLQLKDGTCYHTLRDGWSLDGIERALHHAPPIDRTVNEVRSGATSRPASWHEGKPEDCTKCGRTT